MRLLAAFVLTALSLQGHAAELKLLTTGAYKPVAQALAAGFEQRTGHRVTIDNDTAGGVARRVAAGEPVDLVVMSPAGVDTAALAGHVQGASKTLLAKVAIGVAVRPGAPPPAIGSVDEFKATLRAARRIATIDPAAGGSSGIYLWKLFEQWGLADELKAKAVLVPGGLVATKVMNGEADIALHQISEILAVPGAVLVGPLPAAIQNHTVYAGAVSSRAREAEAAKALLQHLAGPQAAAVLADKGMEAP